MSSGAFSSRALRIGATCKREAIIALKSSKKSPLYSSGRRKIAMLPTCIGISGVSRYRNDASIEDSFLASAIFSSRSRQRGALVALLAFRSSLLLEHDPILKIADNPASIAEKAVPDHA